MKYLLRFTPGLSALSSRGLRFILATGMLALMPGWAARAADTTATFNTGNQSLYTGAYYTPNIVVASATTTDVIFAGSYTYSSSLLISSYGAASLNFGTLDDLDTTQALTAEAYGSGGNANLYLNSTANDTAVTGAGSASDLLYVAPGANLTLTGVNAYLGLTVETNGNFDIQGAATLNTAIGLYGPGNITKTGTGTLTLTGNPNYSGNDYNTYTGLFTVAQGTLVLQGDNGSTQTSNGNNQGFKSALGLTVDSGATVSLTTNNDALTTAGNTSVVVTVNQGGLISLDGAGTTDNVGTLVLNGGTLTTGAAYTSVSSYGSFDFIGTVAVGGTSVSTISAQSMGLNTSGGVTFNVAPTGDPGGVDLNVTGTFAHNASGTDTGLIKAGYGVMQLSGINTYTGPTSDNLGTLILNETSAALSGTGVLVSTGTLTMGSGQLEVTGGSQTLGRIASAGEGSISLAAGVTLTSGTFVDNNFYNEGSSLNINVSAGGANASTSTLGTSVFVPFGGSVTITGTSLSGGFTVTDAGGTGFLALNSSGDAVRLIPGAGSLIPQYANSNGDFSLSGTLALNGSEPIRSLTVNSSVNSPVLNLGAYFLTNSAYVFTGVNPVSITGSGGIGANGYANDLYLNNYNTAPVTISAPIIADGGGGPSGLDVLGPGTTILTASNTVNNTLTVTQGNLEVAATNGLSHISGVMLVSGSLSVTANSAFATPGAFTTNSVAGLSGTATGQIPINLGQATILRLGVGVSLGSGTSVGMGTLTMSGNGTIDFGSDGSVGTLNFNGFSDANGFTLAILDYNRPADSQTVGQDGIDDRLIFNQQLTAAQLSYFTVDGVAAEELAVGNGEYELVAVPEPSTLALGALGVGMFCLLHRRPSRRFPLRGSVSYTDH